METGFDEKEDLATFYYQEIIGGGEWRKAGSPKKLYFGMDHFAGARCGLGIFATKKTGGTAVFHNFKYEYER